MSLYSLNTGRNTIELKNLMVREFSMTKSLWKASTLAHGGKTKSQMASKSELHPDSRAKPDVPSASCQSKFNTEKNKTFSIDDSEDGKNSRTFLALNDNQNASTRSEDSGSSREQNVESERSYKFETFLGPGVTCRLENRIKRDRVERADLRHADFSLRFDSSTVSSLSGPSTTSSELLASELFDDFNELGLLSITNAEIFNKQLKKSIAIMGRRVSGRANCLLTDSNERNSSSVDSEAHTFARLNQLYNAQISQSGDETDGSEAKLRKEEEEERVEEPKNVIDLAVSILQHCVYNSKNNLLAILILLANTTFVFLNLPYCVWYLRQQWFPDNAVGRAKDELAWTATVLVRFTNHAANFLVYVAFGSRFRGELKMLC